MPLTTTPAPPTAPLPPELWEPVAATPGGQPLELTDPRDKKVYALVPLEDYLRLVIDSDPKVQAEKAAWAALARKALAQRFAEEPW